MTFRNSDWRAIHTIHMATLENNLRVFFIFNTLRYICTWKTFNDVQTSHGLKELLKFSTWTWLPIKVTRCALNFVKLRSVEKHIADTYI